MTKVGINGLGRIGRVVFRKLIMREDIELVAVNDIMPIETFAYLLKYDSNHGVFEGAIEVKDRLLYVNNKQIHYSSFSEPINIPWAEMSVDIVIESSGFFKTYAELEKHIQAGAKKVVLSCPPEGELDKLVVYGINHHLINYHDKIVSNASCTTNCLLPIIHVIEKEFGLEKAFMNTVHPFTNNQRVLDAPHADIRRARALGVNIIPTTSTAVDAIIKILPHLNGRFDGMATRVPVKGGSLIELSLILKRNTTVDEVNACFYRYSVDELKGILSYTDEPIVSSDIIGDEHSVIFDALSTKIIGGNFLQLVVWYDNEFGYSSRIVDLVTYLSNV